MIGVSFTVAFTWLSYGVIFQWIWPHFASFSSRTKLLYPGAALFAGGLLVLISVRVPLIPVQHTLEIVATGQKNPQAQASQVWIGSLRRVNGLPIPNAEMDLVGDWEIQDGVLASYRVQPAIAKWTGLTDRDLELKLGSHTWSGVVQIWWDGQAQQLDLYNKTRTERTVLLPWVGSRQWQLNFLMGVIYGTYVLSLGTLIFCVLYLVVVLRYPLVVIDQFISRKLSLYLSVLIFIILFIISRLWFFWDYPLPLLSPDSIWYYSLAEEIGSEQWPVFGMRPPGYPLLLRLVFSLSDKLWSLLVVQNLLSLASGLCMVYAAYRLDYRLSPWVALAMAVFVSSGKHLDHDTALLSESLYTNCLVLTFSFLILGFATNTPLFLACSSIAMASVILVRPAGLFLIIIYLLVLAFLIWNRYSKQNLLSFSLPMPIILLALCFYNYFTLGAFAITVWGEANLSGATVIFWEKDERFSNRVNTVIEQIQLAVSKEDQAILHTSWQLDELYLVFEKNYNPLLHLTALPLLIPKKNALMIDYRAEDTRQMLREISITAIQKHPELYLKFILSNLWQYFVGNIQRDWNFHDIALGRAFMIYEAKFHTPYLEDSLDFMAKEYANPPDIPGITIHDAGETTNITLTMTPALFVSNQFYFFRSNLFNQPLWSVIYGTVFGLSTVMLLLTQGRHKGIFILFILTLSAFGASLVICLVEVALPRYSYPTEFIVYLSTVLSPILWVYEGSQ